MFNSLEAHSIAGKHPFVMDGLPWFSYTSWWSRFSAEEQLTANRLMGLLVNDVFLFIERDLILPMIESARRDPAVRRRSGLLHALDSMALDEHRHVVIFSEFSKRHSGETGRKSHKGFSLLTPPWLVSQAARIGGSFPLWRMLWWAVLATEEWTTTFATQLDLAPCGKLGPRDPEYCSLHAVHCLDEQRHIATGVALGAAWDEGIPLERSLAARAAITLMQQLLIPRRSIASLVQAFCHQHPRWAADERAIGVAILAGGRDQGYWQAIMPDPTRSRALAEWHKRAEFNQCVSPFPGWSPTIGHCS